MFASRNVNYSNIANALNRMVHPLAAAGELPIARRVVNLSWTFRITHLMQKSKTPWLD